MSKTLLSAQHHDPTDVAFYHDLLARMRAKQPLSNAATCLPRSFKPM